MTKDKIIGFVMMILGLETYAMDPMQPSSSKEATPMDLEIQSPEDNPVRYWFLNQSATDVIIKIETYLSDPDLKLDLKKEIRKNSIQCLTQQEFISAETAYLKYVENPKIPFDPRIEFHKCDYKIISRFPVWRQNLLREGNPDKSDSLLGNWLPFGSTFIIKPHFSGLNFTPFYSIFTAFYEKLKYPFIKDKNFPFTLLPREIKWEIFSLFSIIVEPPTKFTTEVFLA